MRVCDYMRSLIGKRCAVIGAGISNMPLIELLLDAGNNVTVCDKRSYEQLGENVRALESRGVHWKLGEDYLTDIQADILFRTPGLHPRFLQQYKSAGCIVTSEMELFFRFCPCHTIAVTGSDGKTTTSTVISELLKAQGFRVHLGGNIGRPLLSEVDSMLPEDYAVLELSSFQLHSMQCNPDRAIITNISPNHLDVHPDMDDYILAKTMVFRGQSDEGRVVLNADDAHTSELLNLVPGKISLFSRRNSVDNGACLDNGVLCLVHDGLKDPILAAEDIRIPGNHNVENYLAAFAVTDGIVSKDIMRSVARCFGGVEHRIEFLRELHGVRYYNDSIASSPTRTAAGLHSFKEKPILIAGGYDKHIPFEGLGEEIVHHVKALCLNGATAEKIKMAVVNADGYDCNNLPIYMDENFDASVARAVSIAEAGDVVLMSPACAAFDQFSNFAVRGNHFRDLIMGLEG